jgi:ketosteroid isomerase-like protein
MRIARSVEECDELFARFVVDRDLDGLVSLYESSACLVQRDGTVVIGHDRLRTALSILTTERTEMRMLVVRVVESDGIAAIYNDWNVRRTSADGSTTEWSGRAIEIVRRQSDGRWLFAIDDPFARSR